MPVYECNRQYKEKILYPGTPDYETCRRNNPSGDAPDEYPAEIHVVHDVEDVVFAVRRANELKKDIGIRSGGHTLSNGALFTGILIDTTHLNRNVEYDSGTHDITFGPSVRVQEIAEKLREINRFYPHGHCPTVAAGGFHLGGGQGVGMRGTGPTYRDWLTQLEIVVADGRVVIASEKENSDLFWAARGCGPAFFGVITKFWGKTTPRTKWWGQHTAFDLGNNYKPLMKWFIEQSKKTPKKVTELNAGVFYPEKAAAKSLPDKPPAEAKLTFIITNIALTDTESEAKGMLAAYEDIPTELRSSVLESSFKELALEDMWAEQDMLWSSDNSEHWRFQSLCTDESVDLNKLLDATEPIQTDIPTLRSVSLAVIPNWEPNEEACAYSVPIQLYLCSFAGWADPNLTPLMKDHWRSRYKKLLPFSSGMFPADYDVTNDEGNSTPLSNTALTRFMDVGKKWDPQQLFPARNKYVSTSEKMKNLWQKSDLGEL
ncbi:oxidoreductase [Aspergillus novoparasiticus]|uniref:Oxidoreductase n=1 Tax=Aspergillus novoparasiticus TaxID=986946 RepID=A0A5N6ED89_9EURO|nr:oxidoreductase [Aspergillus novoparasiticus]